MQFGKRLLFNVRHHPSLSSQASAPLTCMGDHWPSLFPFLPRGKVLEWACQYRFDWHDTSAHKHSFVPSLCVRRRWRGPILHSRVDRSLVYFIHFTWRDACLSWLDASLRFTQHCTRQTMHQFCPRPPSSGERPASVCPLLYTFWVKISLALLFSGQGVLVYRKSCQRALPHLSHPLSPPLRVCVSCSSRKLLSVLVMCICPSLLIDRSIPGHAFLGGKHVEGTKNSISALCCFSAKQPVLSTDHPDEIRCCVLFKFII